MKKILMSFFTISFFLTSASALKTYNISQEKLNTIHIKYGNKAKKRVLLWDKTIQNARKKDILNKLKDVNDFWNKIKYRTDKEQWGKEDYLATPFEFLGSGLGDCEDYANAKLFSLRKLGIPKNKLKITSVKLKHKRNHTVLTYHHKPGSIPIVLDNINKKLKLLTKRLDLEL